MCERRHFQGLLPAPVSTELLSSGCRMFEMLSAACLANIWPVRGTAAVWHIKRAWRRHKVCHQHCQFQKTNGMSIRDTEEGKEKRSTECLVLLTRSGRVTYNAYVTIAESGRGKPLGANTLIVIIESSLRENVQMHGGVKGSARMPGPSPIRHPAPPPPPS